MQQKGLLITDLSSDDDVNSTMRAMKTGVDIIYQAPLALSSFKGIADFLVKTPGKSALGDFHYEIRDTKLARTIKPAFIIQLCCYVEMLASLQDLRPIESVVSLGSDEELLDDMECLAQCRRTEKPPYQLSERSKNLISTSRSL